MQNINKADDWAVRHGDKLPEISVYLRYSALKILKIHKVFLRFFPWLAQISAHLGCYAVLKWQLFFKTNNKLPGMLTHFGKFLCGIGG